MDSTSRQRPRTDVPASKVGELAPGQAEAEAEGWRQIAFWNSNTDEGEDRPRTVAEALSSNADDHRLLVGARRRYRRATRPVRFAPLGGSSRSARSFGAGCMTELMARARSQSFGGLLRRVAARAPEKPVVLDGVTQFTYDELDRVVSRTANALTLRGIIQGDRIALLSRNCGGVRRALVRA
jgi:non-ribosomal peptide synthetase component F